VIFFQADPGTVYNSAA